MGILCPHCAETNLATDFAEAQAKKIARLKDLVTEAVEITEEAEALQSAAAKKTLTHEQYHMGIVMLCFIFMAVWLSFTAGSSALLTEEQIAIEEQRRDQIESCVQNFWEIAQLLQRDQLPDLSHGCTEVGEPQVVTRVGDDIIVSHPSPELLGYSQIVVSKYNPVPVLVN